MANVMMSVAGSVGRRFKSRPCHLDDAYTSSNIVINSQLTIAQANYAFHPSGSMNL